MKKPSIGLNRLLGCTHQVPLHPGAPMDGPTKANPMPSAWGAQRESAGTDQFCLMKNIPKNSMSWNMVLEFGICLYE